MVKEIIILGPDRAGTTFFCSLFDYIENVKTSDNFRLYEILKKKQKLPFVEKVKILKKFINSEPENFDKLYKVLYHQMNFSQIKKYLETKKQNQDIKNQPNDVDQNEVLVIVLTRNLVDMYISHCKAKKSNQWVNHNTTDLKIKFKENEFEEWIKPRVKYIKNLSKYLKNQEEISWLYFDYQEIHKLNSFEEKLKYVIEKISKKSQIEFSILEKENKMEKIKKQDQNSSFENKIKNYQDLEKYLKKTKTRIELKDFFS